MTLLMLCLNKKLLLLMLSSVLPLELDTSSWGFMFFMKIKMPTTTAATTHIMIINGSNPATSLALFYLIHLHSCLCFKN